MKNSKIYFLILSFIIVSFDIAMVFILNIYSVKNTRIIYVVSKCISVIALISVCVMGLCKNAVANYILQYAITIIFQFIPLIIRYVSAVKNGFIISVVIFAVSSIIYFSMEFGLILLNKKSLNAIERLNGQEIKIKEANEK